MAGTLASVLFVCASAWAQESGTLSADIKERIESTFAMVLGNSAELAIPLTRRALARRSIEPAEDPAVDALAYRDPSAEVAPEHTAAIPPAAPPSDASTAPAAASAEDGSSAEEDPDVARMPRPRPRPAATESASAETAPVAEEAMGGPLDLVAGAAVEDALAATEDAPVVVASADPQPLLTAAPASPTATPTIAANTELVATGPCLAPSDVSDKDGDFKRNAGTLSANTFCIAEEKFTERRRKWTIATIRTSRPGPLWAVMHDDEDMSFDNAVEALKAYGGTLVAIETGGRRNMDGVDPNRNFSADGIGCKKLGNDATPEFTGFMAKLFDPSQPIIALHNNTGEKISTGGLGHVSMDDVPKEMEKHASEVNGPLAGDRALVLFTSVVPVSTTSKSQADALSAKGINALIEKVREGKGDCSLSNYTLLSGHPDYMNVTVDKDERDKQRQIVGVIMAARNATVATQ